MASFALTENGTGRHLTAIANFTYSMPAAHSFNTFIILNETSHAIRATIDITGDQGSLHMLNHNSTRRLNLLTFEEVDDVVVDSKSFVHVQVRRVDDGTTAADVDITFAGVETMHGSAGNRDGNETVSMIRDVTLAGAI